MLLVVISGVNSPTPERIKSPTIPRTLTIFYIAMLFGFVVGAKGAGLCIFDG